MCIRDRFIVYSRDVGARAVGANTTTWNHYTHSFYNDADARHKAFTLIQPNAFTQAFGKSCTHDTRRFRTYEPKYHKDWSSSERAKTGIDIQGDEKAKKGCEVDTWLPQGRYYWAHATAALCGGLATQVDTTSAAHIPEPRIGGWSATRVVCALNDASHCHRIAK